MSNHCADNAADRELGKFWEKRFCLLAAGFELSFTPMQIGRSDSAAAYSRPSNKWNIHTLPDITVWTYPGQHHEIKHKNPTKHGTFGLEVYRLDALIWFANETQQDVMYTIHNHDLSGGRNGKENKPEHWFTVNVLDLVGNEAHQGEHTDSYVNGKPKARSIYYWKTSLWIPLVEYWQEVAGKQKERIEDKPTVIIPQEQRQAALPHIF